MTKVILIRGLPGSGKSTLARALQQQRRQEMVYQLMKNPSTNVVHLEADMYFVRNGNYEFDATKLRQAHEWCQQSFLQALENKVDTLIVSNTFTTRKEIEWYLDTCETFTVKPQIVTAQGDFDSVHDVPWETMAKMRDRFQHDLFHEEKLKKKKETE